ncbi:MAG: redox-sensing transcriptional repressor Rex [Spirochaetes bacterium GWB1_59_5]|nr:MAG: redox-sensing transcriptional repressor Rex [Spirochaetes bacterium GWB1_59_5]
MPKFKVSYAPSVRRLPSYLLLAKQAQEHGDEYISGTLIALELSLEPIQVRKDLSITGIAGKPKRGYPVVPLISAIESYLNWDKRVDAIVVGAGNLGSALSGFPGFKQHGLYIVAGFDADASKVGGKIHDSPVYPISQLAERISSMNIAVAILTVPSTNAQDVATILVSAGIKAIWNFTNVKLKVPDDVVVQNEDLSSGYAMLSMKRRIKSALMLDDAN